MRRDSNPEPGSYRLPALPLSYASTWRPRRDSNPDARLRRPALCPLSYGGGCKIGVAFPASVSIGHSVFKVRPDQAPIPAHGRERGIHVQG